MATRKCSLSWNGSSLACAQNARRRHSLCEAHVGRRSYVFVSPFFGKYSTDCATHCWSRTSNKHLPLRMERVFFCGARGAQTYLAVSTARSSSWKGRGEQLRGGLTRFYRRGGRVQLTLPVCLDVSARAHLGWPRMRWKRSTLKLELQTARQVRVHRRD